MGRETTPSWEYRELGEECGVVAIYAPGRGEAQGTVPKEVFLALGGVQHRGQDAAGVAGRTGEGITVVGGLGLADVALNGGASLQGLDGDFGLGHVRYATSYMTGHNPNERDKMLAVQPMQRVVGETEFAFGYNGNIENIAELTDKLLQEKGGLSDADRVTDTSVITSLISQRVAKGLLVPEALLSVAREIVGAYSIAIWEKTGESETIWALRDPYGFRPLVLGTLPNKGCMVASEVGALHIAGAEYLREVEAGELVSIDQDGLQSYPAFPEKNIDPRFCIFEKIYLSRPDNIVYDRLVERDRVLSGEELADEHPVKSADVVVGVPESSISAARGYARALNKPVRDCFVRNRYNPKRSFIEATQESREEKVHHKISGVLRDNIADQEIVIVDDSLVRSTTMRILVEMCRKGGAKKIHVRIASPPIVEPCYYGVDMPNKDKLIAARKSVEEICTIIGADSLEYLSIEGLRRANGVDARGRALGGPACRKFCDACMTGDYPTAEHGLALRK
jgi:amidophosphoribosyltransferase